MFPGKSILSVMLFLFVGATACTPSVSPHTTETSEPVISRIVPTDIQLPLNPTVQSDEYCKPPDAVLPVDEGNDISEEQIVYELMKVWLKRYTDSKAPDFCRIDGFTIDKVYYDADVVNKPLEPRGDFMRIVDFSIKLIQIPNAWMSFAGELDQDNWLHVTHVVAVTKTPDGYKMQFAYP